MTHNDIYTKFLIEYDKANVTSSYPALTPYEIATILDRAYLALIARKLTGNNPRRSTFESDTKSIEDLRPLVTTSEVTYGSAKGTAENEYVYLLPDTLLYFLESDVEYGGTLSAADKKYHDREVVDLVSHLVAKNFTATTVNMPWISRPVAFIEDDKIHVLVDPYRHPGGPSTAYVTYIKQFSKFSGEASVLSSSNTASSSSSWSGTSNVYGGTSTGNLSTPSFAVAIDSNFDFTKSETLSPSITSYADQPSVSDTTFTNGGSSIKFSGLVNIQSDGERGSILSVENGGSIIVQAPQNRYIKSVDIIGSTSSIDFEDLPGVFSGNTFTCDPGVNEITFTCNSEDQNAPQFGYISVHLANSQLSSSSSTSNSGNESGSGSSGGTSSGKITFDFSNPASLNIPDLQIYEQVSLNNGIENGDIIMLSGKTLTNGPVSLTFTTHNENFDISIMPKWYLVKYADRICAQYDHNCAFYVRVPSQYKLTRIRIKGALVFDPVQYNGLSSGDGHGNYNSAFDGVVWYPNNGLALSVVKLSENLINAFTQHAYFIEVMYEPK